MPNQSSHLSNDPNRPRRLDRLRDAIRRRYDSRRREEACIHWTKRYIRFHGKRHPSTLGEAEVTAFLSLLATERHVSASSQNQALGLDRYDSAVAPSSRVGIPRHERHTQRLLLERRCEGGT